MDNKILNAVKDRLHPLLYPDFDKVALKAVIVQAVHLIDPISGQYHLDRSQWGPVQFGRVEPVRAVIHSVLEGLS